MPIIDEDDVVYEGTENADTIYLLGNRGVIDGLDGADRITASVLSYDAEYSSIATTLTGGKGQDILKAHLTLTDDYSSTDPAITANMDGGDGNDLISVKIEVANFVGYSTNIWGGDGNDIIHVTATGEDSAYARADIYGGDGYDEIVLSFWDTGYFGFGDDGIVTVHGGAGEDLIQTFLRSPTGDLYTDLFGGDQNDQIIGEVYASGTQELGGDAYLSVDGGTGNDDLTLSSRSDSGAASAYVNGGIGNDTISAEARAWMDFDETTASVEIHGGAGSDQVASRVNVGVYEWDTASGLAFLYGDEGDDHLTSTIRNDQNLRGDFHSSLYGGTGNDRLKVSGGTDNFLWGNQGDDTLLGSANDDHLIGGRGDDYLKGYGGADSFEFQSARNGERDRIADFAIGEDVMDLSKIDANVWRGGNQAFSFDGTGHGGTGRVWVEDYGSRTIVHADTGKAVLDIVLLDGWSTQASDYSASDFIL